MKKITLLIILIILLLTTISIYFISQKDSIDPYYKKLIERCELTDGKGCCLAAVRIMTDNNYKEAVNRGCPSGYKLNNLKCPTTIYWCKPI